MSRSVEDDWVLDEAEALLDMDGRTIQPVDPATARDRIEKRLRGRCTRWRGPAARS